MAGFLEKDKRLVDYKLTEFGREKLATKGLDFKYYTFSDSSIFYKEDKETSKNFKVSSKEAFNLLEVDTTSLNIINPEYTLSSVITFDQLDNNLLFTNKEINSTLSDYLIDLKLLDNKNLSSRKSNTIKFDYQLDKDRNEFDFKNRVDSYPTISSHRTSLRELKPIKDEKRFSDYIRNKLLPPKNIDGDQSVINTSASRNPLEYIFKSMKSEGNLPVFRNKDDYIVDLLNFIESNGDLFKLDYVLNEEEILDEDVYLFEMHEVNDTSKKLKKLAFVNLGSFYDKKTYMYKSVYLIGKIYLTSNLKEEINTNSKRKKFILNNDYSFINMFTLVVE
jgi:hypothetical protein